MFLVSESRIEPIDAGSSELVAHITLILCVLPLVWLRKWSN
jgi:hypothetical protein